MELLELYSVLGEEGEAVSSERPMRCFEVTITVGGDTWEDVRWQLQGILPHIEDHGPDCKSVSGSPTSNHVVHVVHNPEMTNEKYFAAIEAWRSLRDKEKA